MVVVVVVVLYILRGGLSLLYCFKIFELYHLARYSITVETSQSNMDFSVNCT